MVNKIKRNIALRKIIFGHTIALSNISDLIDEAINNFCDTFNRGPNEFDASDMDFISCDTELLVSSNDLSEKDLFIMRGIGLEV